MFYLGLKHLFVEVTAPATKNESEASEVLHLSHGIITMPNDGSQNATVDLFTASSKFNQVHQILRSKNIQKLCPAATNAKRRSRPQSVRDAMGCPTRQMGTAQSASQRGRNAHGHHNGSFMREFTARMPQPQRWSTLI